MSYLVIDDLSVVFRQFQLRGISLALEQGQTMVLLGPSGSGKSVLLETIAGFHAPSAGRIWLAGQEMTRLPPEARGVGFMFQDYALFPHLTVQQNVAFGLRGGRGGDSPAEARVEEVLDLVGARHLAGRRTSKLSGGEKQRVALARAMAIHPRLFLFDEPLSALDAMMRDNLREEMRRQLRSLGATSVYVTHDRQEALMLADVLAIIQNGVIRQAGAAAELFAHPADAWVAQFLGLQVLRPQSLEPVAPGRVRMRVGNGFLEAAVNGRPIPPAAHLAFRPEDVHLEGLNGHASASCIDSYPPASGNGAYGIPAVVDAVVPLGPLSRIDLNGGSAHGSGFHDAARFQALLLRPEFQRLGLKPGDRVLATLHPNDLVLVPEGPSPADASER
jgi:ABC-type Fe3+/spermidine/putrescine transport system ATPase subunit